VKPTNVKDLDYYLNLRCKTELIPDKEGGWGALIPELTGCVGAGDTIAEALEMLEDAKVGWLTSLPLR
jgi:predicted RNase H-like HicB family nuclease